MSKFRKGDRVTVEAVIDSEWTHDGKIKVRVDPYHEVFVSVADLTMRRPTFQVGDTVEYGAEADRYRGKILAIADDHAWVSFGNGHFGTVWLETAERIDVDETGREAA